MVCLYQLLLSSAKQFFTALPLTASTIGVFSGATFFLLFVYQRAAGMMAAGSGSIRRWRLTGYVRVCEGM